MKVSKSRNERFNGMVEALKENGLTEGQDFEVVTSELSFTRELKIKKGKLKNLPKNIRVKENTGKPYLYFHPENTDKRVLFVCEYM